MPPSRDLRTDVRDYACGAGVHCAPYEKSVTFGFGMGAGIRPPSGQDDSTHDTSTPRGRSPGEGLLIGQQRASSQAHGPARTVLAGPSLSGGSTAAPGTWTSSCFKCGGGHLVSLRIAEIRQKMRKAQVARMSEYIGIDEAKMP